MLSYPAPYFPIAVIILFQSEIRRTARIGRKRFLGKGFHTRIGRRNSCWP